MLASALAVFAAPRAQGAESWGIEGERAAIVKGKVVDLLCEISGRCAPDCGGGTRQLGLIDADGKLLPAAKSNTLFAGAVVDLLPFCGKTVEADALVIESPRMRLLFVQKLKGPGDKEFKAAEAFGDQWTKKHGKADEWFRKDPDVKTVIAADGVFGIKGLEPAK
ncbi:hypothetical protein [Methyloraptor flagellatus]|uniref:Uncharacterized protein n=1 Tax=Methyloraptor flagellatus TaxID=3162530 RepID=A0AAU7XE65_9HYPH